MWAFEVARALDGTPLRRARRWLGGTPVAFAAADGQQPGPRLVRPCRHRPRACRSKRLGEALLRRCAEDVRGLPVSASSRIRTKAFYSKTVGAVDDASSSFRSPLEPSRSSSPPASAPASAPSATSVPSRSCRCAITPWCATRWRSTRRRHHRDRGQSASPRRAAARRALGDEVRYSEEETILGTGGAASCNWPTG